MSYFQPAAFRFLRELTRHNERAWFHANKARYESAVRDPMLKLIGDLAEPLAKISPHYRADPRTVGGSLFRIQRDTRFANDKTPYKTHVGMRFFHERGREAEAPSFYLHVQPGNCFVGAGLWHPQPDTLRRVRHFVVDNPGSWKAAAHGDKFRKRFDLDDSEMLVRPPRGYPADFVHLDDLRRKNHVALRHIDDATMTGPRLLATLGKDLQQLGPFVDYLCAALDLEF